MAQAQVKRNASVAQRLQGGLAKSRHDVNGMIFKIERHAVHDGPGIRTVIFFKGCPLHCQWCSSPESQRRSAEMAHYTARCRQCQACLSACPLGAISKNAGGGMQTDPALCDHCGECAQACNFGARRLIGEETSLAQVVHAIEKDEVFYFRSGGGVTLSGGEPTAQPEFAQAILAACNQRAIHTAMETCGHVSWSVFEPLLRRLDLVYIDIKHSDADLHAQLTGVPNDVILENLRRVDARCRHTRLIVRVPVIPGFNDDVKTIEAIGALGRQLDRLERIELLPFHRYGSHVYAALGKPYAFEGANLIEAGHLQKLAHIIRSQGVQAQIGG